MELNETELKALIKESVEGVKEDSAHYTTALKMLIDMVNKQKVRAKEYFTSFQEERKVYEEAKELLKENRETVKIEEEANSKVRSKLDDQLDSVAKEASQVNSAINPVSQGIRLTRKENAAETANKAIKSKRSRFQS